MAKPLEVTAANFRSEVLESDGLVMVDFWAAWCGPCRMVGPIIDQLAEDYAGKVKVCKLNVDEEQALAARYEILSIPSLLIFKNGAVVERSVGAKPRPALAAMLDALL